MKVTQTFIIGLFAVIGLVGCNSHGQLPGGKSFLVIDQAEQRSPFGTNQSESFAMECTEKISHWYKSDEFPREHCQFIGQTAKVAEPAPAVLESKAPVAPVEYRPNRKPIKIVKAVQKLFKPLTTESFRPTTVLMPSQIIRPLLVAESGPQPQYFKSASSTGGGYQALSGAFIGTGIGVMGAVLRPSQINGTGGTMSNSQQSTFNDNVQVFGTAPANHSVTH